MSQVAIHSASWLVNPRSVPLAGGAIAVKDGLIIDCGIAADLALTHSATVVDHPGCVLIPGFINAHTHLELTHFPAWREQNGMGYSPRSFVDWIIQLIKIKRTVSPAQLQASQTEGLRKCLQSGTTAVGDILSHYELLSCYGSSPIGGRVFFELLGHDSARFRNRLNEALVSVNSLSGTNSILPALSPHAPYTIGEDLLAGVQTAAGIRDLPLAIHISESEAENSFMFDTSGAIADVLYPFIDWQQYLTPSRHCSPTAYFDRNGLLTDKTMAVHCVHVNIADVQLIHERGASICLCPRSNERLDVGRAPVSLFKKLNIPLALGTDSLASNDSLSLWDEMRFALNQFEAVLSPADLFEMVTSGGAAALSLSDHIGTLAVGKRADFQVVELKQAVTKETVVDTMVLHGESTDVYVAGVQCT